MRDLQLDSYRAIVRIFVIVVSHTMWWLEAVTEAAAGAFLFSMPLLFFIAGAAASFKPSHRTFRHTVANRVSKVLVPAWIFLLVCGTVKLVLLLLDIYPWHNPGFRPGTAVSSLLFTAFLGEFEDFAPGTAHIWFILPYFLVAISVPLQTRLSRHVNRWVLAGTALLAAKFAWVLPLHWGWTFPLAGALFYNFFFMAGFLFYRKLRNRTIAAIGTAALLMLVINAHRGGLSPHALFEYMNRAKFEYHSLFLWYSLASLCLFSLIAGRFSLPHGRFLQLWNRHGYHIYIWHSWIYLPVLTWILPLVAPHVGQGLHALIIYSIFILPLATAIGWIHKRLHETGKRKPENGKLETGRPAKCKPHT